MKRWNEDITLHTERLRLIPITQGLLDSTCAYALDSEILYMIYLPYASREECRQAIQRAEAQWHSPQPAYYEFAILTGDDHIGGITLYMLEEAGSGELGWVLHPAWRGRGYAREAARALMAQGMKDLGLTRFIAQCDSENEGSRRLMEQLGMTLISRLPGRKNRSGNGERFELTYEILL